MAKFMPRRILCPVDFSDYSATALQIAGYLAQSFDAEIRVFHAQRFDAPVYFTSAQLQSLKKQLRRSLRGAREFLEDFANRHLPDNVRRSMRLVEGDPVDAILDAHKEWDADLLVMATHGRTGLTRIRLGSVMESVLRQIKGFVLTVGPGITTSPGPIRRILSPVDFSELSQAVLGLSVDIAQQTDAEVTVLHASERAAREGPDMAAALCEWISPEARARCRLREFVREGKASETIVSEAKKARADLIVLGAAPRGYLGQLVFGSTTEAVIRMAPCPVLSVIRAPRGRVSS